jgi:hypothetical protein
MAIQPGSVDMLGPIRLDTAMPRTHYWAHWAWRPRGPVLRQTLDRGTARCSLERR